MPTVYTVAVRALYAKRMECQKELNQLWLWEFKKRRKINQELYRLESRYNEITSEFHSLEPLPDGDRLRLSEEYDERTHAHIIAELTT